MCTVSYVPLQNGFVLTSNRDEKIYRSTIPPKVYLQNNVKYLYPKDEKAGGSWIVAREDGVSIVLLNGAFINHQKKTNYSKSRGIILMEIIQTKFPLLHFLEMNLDNVEPFTLIIFQHKILTEVKWDGKEKHTVDKSIKKPHIWSSATLYNRNQKSKRKQWFEEFTRYNNSITTEKVFLFHSTTQATNTEYGLVINREDLTKTVSITQLLFKDDKFEMTYLDRLTNTITEKITF